MKSKSFVLVGLVLATQAGHADALSDAQARRAQAYNDYFNALQQGHVRNPAEAQRLATQIVTPASEEVSKQIQEGRKSAIAELFGPQDPKRAQTASRSPAAASNFSTSSEPAALDGSNVPSELEFKPSKPASNLKLRQTPPAPK